MVIHLITGPQFEKLLHIFSVRFIYLNSRLLIVACDSTTIPAGKLSNNKPHVSSDISFDLLGGARDQRKLTTVTGPAVSFGFHTILKGRNYYFLDFANGPSVLVL